MPYFFISPIEKAICVVGDVGILGLDHLVGLRIVAVEIVVPADRGRVDEALDEIGRLFDDSLRVTISVE